MSTPNKFSNPDVPACDCPRAYAHCLVIGPLQGIFCLPFVCCARVHKEHQKERETEARVSQGPIEEQPSQPPNMSMLADASKPRDQWPAEWHHAAANGATRQVTETTDGTRAGVEHEGDDRTVKDKLVDGVLKVATFA